MNTGPGLVLKGTLIGSMVVALLGWLLGAHIKLVPETEVAYAAPAEMTPGEITPAPTLPQPVEPPAQPAQCQVSGSYPDGILQWCEIITRYAVEAGLAPDFVAAVMLQESGGDAMAYSTSGAVGLLQVMPRDGLAADFHCANGPCFASRPTIAELSDPAYNVEYGTRMLARLVDRLGSLREALKAYGPVDVGYAYADKVLAIYARYR